VRVQALSERGVRRLRLAVHLVTRFVGALSPVPPAAGDEAWVAAVLGEHSATHHLWATMSAPDRRHAIGVARRVDDACGGAGPDELAAALLHDVGKVVAGFGTLARVPATLAGLGGGRQLATAWSTRPAGLRRRVGDYLIHDLAGARLLRDAGAPALAAAWAEEHHRPEATWTVPIDVGRRLKGADDD